MIRSAKYVQQLCNHNFPRILRIAIGEWGKCAYCAIHLIILQAVTKIMQQNEKMPKISICAVLKALLKKRLNHAHLS